MRNRGCITVRDLETQVRALFADRFDGLPDLVAYAPGRVNLIGEHTDYNDGFVLPMAIGRGAIVAARARHDGIVSAYAGDYAAESRFLVSGAIAADMAQPWANYVRGVAAGLREQGMALAGADLAVLGDVPMGAGLSSSAALEMAAGLALAAIAGRADYDRTQLALAGQYAEHAYAGCQCGIMDQLVSARAQAGAALLIDCRSLAARPVTLGGDAAVMIVHSGVSRGLVEGAYNSRRAQCETAAAHFGVAALRDIDLAAFEAGKGGLDPTSVARARHVISENARVLAAADALAAGDLVAVGALMAQSHRSMRDDFAITVPPVDALVAILQAAIGEQGGARMTGGGFGGAVVAVMRRDAVPAVATRVQAEYRTPAGDAPIVMVESPAAGARLLS